MSTRKTALALAVATLTCGSAARATLTLQFDYSLDVNGFFADPGRRATLEEAGRVFTDRFLDSFTAITPGPSGFDLDNTWTASFNHPGTGGEGTKTDIQIAADTVLVYAGGYDLPGNTLGFGGPGGFGTSGTSEFNDNLRTRGQAGMTLNPQSRTDFATWGGSITFDTATNWNFSLAAPPAPGQSDFYSVAVHELGHLLGFGTAASFQNLSSFGRFAGPKSVAEYGSQPFLNAELDGTYGHWADGTMSRLGMTPQEADMDPTVTVGARKYFTALDLAGMDDLGWDLPIPGDINLDGKINIDDYYRLDMGYLTRLTGYRNGDLDGNGVLDLTDYDLLGQFYTAFHGTPMQFSPSVVPEPAALASAALAALLLLRRRRA